MTALRRIRDIALAAVLIAACKQEDTQHKSDQSAANVVDKQQDLRKQENRQARRAPTDKKVDELGLARDDFEVQRTLRIETLRAVHAITAAQRPMMRSLADTLPLTEIGKEQVKEKLDVLQLRLDETGNLIEGLRHVDAGQWKDRDGQVENAMKNLDDARKDAWKAVENAPRKDRSS